MLEYIFFAEPPWRSFLEYLENLDLTPKSTLTEETWLVALPEDIEDELFDRIEAFYDQMLDYNEELIAEAEGMPMCIQLGSISPCRMGGSSRPPSSQNSCGDCLKR
jgi:hypothetical protein